MLITRIAPSLVKATRAQFHYASCQSVLLQSVNKMSTKSMNRMATGSIGSEPNSMLSGSPLKSYNLTVCKAYSTKQPELPSKQELEKYFFKVTVVIWDLMWKITMWSWAMFRKHIINNVTVQAYWKTFNQKLEEARKN